MQEAGHGRVVSAYIIPGTDYGFVVLDGAKAMESALQGPPFMLGGRPLVARPATAKEPVRYCSLAVACAGPSEACQHAPGQARVTTSSLLRTSRQPHCRDSAQPDALLGQANAKGKPESALKTEAARRAAAEIAEQGLARRHIVAPPERGLVTYDDL